MHIFIVAPSKILELYCEKLLTFFTVRSANPHGTTTSIERRRRGGCTGATVTRLIAASRCNQAAILKDNFIF